MTGAVVHGRESVNFFSVYFCDGRVRGERDEKKTNKNTGGERGPEGGFFCHVMCIGRLRARTRELTQFDTIEACNT